MIELFLKAETDIINEIGRLRSRGLVDYHAVAALERVQKILRQLGDDCQTYAPRMIEMQFYVNHPEARKPLDVPETPEKHLRGYQNAFVLTSTQTDIVERLTMNLMGQVAEASQTVSRNLENMLIGRVENDPYRRVGLSQTAAMQATGQGAWKPVPGFVEALRREGITAFTDKAGRNWNLHTYGSMVLRTTSRQAEVLAVLTQDPEQDLYMISAHGSTCPLCAPLEGRVYSQSGRDPDFPPLTAAFGKMDPAGPDTLDNSWLNIHPNCLHQIIRWTPMGRSEEEIRRIKEFSSFEKNPVTRDPRTQKQVEAYRQKERDRARWLRDYRQWEKYRDTLGDAVPRRFETFRKHKLAGDEKFQAWKSAVQKQNRLDKFSERVILDEREQGAVTWYIGGSPYAVNRALREGGTLGAAELQTVAALDSALLKLPVYQGTVTRDLKFFSLEEFRQFASKYVVGAIIGENSYASASVGKVYQDLPQVRMVIKAKNARDLRAFNPDEAEVLFPRGTAFQILSVKRKGQMFVMEAEEV